MEKKYIIEKVSTLYSFNKVHFENYIDYSKNVSDIDTLEEFGINNELDVRVNNVKLEYIKWVRTKINICCNIIPDYLSFESYCKIKNLNPYELQKKSEENSDFQKTKILY